MRTPYLVGLVSTIVFSEKMTSHTVADTSLEHLHGSGAQIVEAAGSSQPQIHKGSSARESAYVSDENVGESAQVKFKVVDGTEPTLSMTMLVANGNQEAKALG